MEGDRKVQSSRALALAQAEERGARAWANSLRLRSLNLQKAVEAAVLASDGPRVPALRAELQIARNAARLAAEDAAGYRRIARRLSA
jgi:hypothetical protein